MSVFNSHRANNTTMQVFCGTPISGSPPSPVIGKLRFSSNSAAPAEATIAVTDKLIGAESLGENCIVGMININAPSSTVQGNASICPTIALDSLPVACDGKIALLDPMSGRIFVSPDIDTVNHYVPRLISFKPDFPTLFTPKGKRVRVYRHLSDTSNMSEEGSGFIFYQPSRRNYFENELYELYRDTLESAAGRSVFFVIDADGDIEKHLRATLCAAVYGRASLFFRGIFCLEQLKKTLDTYKRVFCQLEAEGREFNGYVPRGLYLDAPAMLVNNEPLDGLDICVIDVKKLFLHLCGGHQAEALELERTSLISLAEKLISRSPKLRYSAILNGDVISKHPCRELMKAEISLFFVSDNDIARLENVMKEISKDVTPDSNHEK